MLDRSTPGWSPGRAAASGPRGVAGWLLAVALLVPVAAARSQEATAPDALDKLKRDLLVEAGKSGEQAAAELFLTPRLRDLGPEGCHDEFLLGVITNRETRRESRRSILGALSLVGKYRVEPACRLVQEALDDPAPTVSQEAVKTLPALDHEGGKVYEWVQQQLTGDLRRSAPGSARHKQAMALVEALERMPNPIESVGVLVTALEQPRLGRTLETRVRESLQRMTAHSFEAPGDWRKWYDDARQRSLAEWRLDVARRRDDRLRRFESEAERYFNKLLARLQGDRDALFQELQAALTEPDTVFAVRRAAIRELGALGRRGEERAVNLLRGRLLQGGLVDYDETKALVIEAVGETGNRALLDDVVQFLTRGFHLRMRLAAAGAVGALQAPGGVEPLLAVLAEVKGPTPPPDDLLEVVVLSLGRIGQNPDGKVSGALMDLVRGLRGGNNGAAHPVSTALLAAVARALGSLGYGQQGEAERVTALLEELARHDDPNVRFFATSALGSMAHSAASFPALRARLRDETAVHVRRAILDAIGQQGLDRPELVQEAMGLLVPFLYDQDDALRRKARQRLEELATRPPGFRENFAGLDHLVQALVAISKPPSDAVSFLTGDNGLPPPDALTQAQQAHRDRYFALLRHRAAGQLETDPQAALADFDAVIRGLNLSAPATRDARGLRLGKARAMVRLTLPQPREALSLVSDSLKSDDAGERAEGWTVAFEVLDKLRAAEPAALPDALRGLQAVLAGAPADAQARFAELLRATAPGPGR
ncbi:MAG: HEAT repeat domain-containing protein [Planctomycetes bacterium]|nr:HEAT repeat domain-containing protein [Planctomycetota bacterium]